MRSLAQMNVKNLIGSEPHYQAPAVGKHDISPQVAKFVDRLFTRLKAIFPAWRTAFDGDEGYQEAKHLWLEALLNNGITTAEQFKRGIAQAERSTIPFFPSVGQFIEWCNAEDYQALNLPDAEQLYRRIQKFMGYGMEEVHRFKFNSDAEYWLITGLYQRNRAGEWTEQQLREAVRKALSKMAKRIKAGEPIPTPTITLPQRVETPMSTAQIEQKWANIWAILGKRK